MCSSHLRSHIFLSLTYVCILSFPSYVRGGCACTCSSGDVQARCQCVYAAHRVLGDLQPLRRTASTSHGRCFRYTSACFGTCVCMDVVSVIPLLALVPVCVWTLFPLYLCLLWYVYVCVYVYVYIITPLLALVRVCVCVCTCISLYFRKCMCTSSVTPLSYDCIANITLHIVIGMYLCLVLFVYCVVLDEGGRRSAFSCLLGSLSHMRGTFSTHQGKHPILL